MLSSDMRMLWTNLQIWIARALLQQMPIGAKSELIDMMWTALQNGDIFGDIDKYTKVFEDSSLVDQALEPLIDHISTSEMMSPNKDSMAQLLQAFGHHFDPVSGTHKQVRTVPQVPAPRPPFEEEE